MVLHWTAYDHEHIERGSDWYWALGIFAVCAALTSILFHDVLFAILIILAAVTLGMLARTPPELTEIEISEKGIRVGDTMHQYHEIISFWVEEHGDVPLLLVDTIKFMSPNLIIPIEHEDASLVRAYLKEHSKEVHMKEPIAHKILEFFGL
ncbi:MAG: hypothetical protein UY70_C0032G0006 [Candidatus Kaiserbacteria bacterium GW2011_GWB1_52_6]|uniref:DUF5673 domain-containing protein n=2 Tax=Candidatus Kaiseribacteriota TaxID=1752734 RepID=A0A0G1ZEF8_9BACT|nr:MAG: hypothetical protein UY67_C0003G0001 [Candidatus Kaiserbacteria bacterium GW2011_GWA2_52_12]KKW26222.1 MAG: hypothetical protein UY70_C0032G0006 [Candidatus Kaiserbacteria bacterium GW2011_GWB1_52_6]